MSRLLIAFAGLMLLGACSVEVTTESKAAESTTTSSMPSDSQTLEVGCYRCTFAVDGAEGCELAVKVDDKPYLVTGVNANAHALGLCTASETPKMAELSGSVEGDQFVATAFSLKP